MMLTLGCFTAYLGEFIGECPLCWMGLRFGALLSLIALVLLALIRLIRSGVTGATHYTLCLGCCHVHCFRLHRKCHLTRQWSEPLGRKR